MVAIHEAAGSIPASRSAVPSSRRSCVLTNQEALVIRLGGFAHDTLSFGGFSW